MTRHALILGATLAFVALAAPIAPLGLAQAQAGKGKAPSAAELDTLLAPVALYPDQLLAQMLLCASNPGKVAALDEWLRSQTALKGTELQVAAAGAGFDDSFAALALFPDVVRYMATQVDWTTRLGQAFAADNSAVFASIQRLRKKAKDAGNLKTTSQQEVETRTASNGQQVIVIEPANPQVVYVPEYNPQIVYVEQESSSAGAAAAGAMIGFAAGIAIGAAIDNDYYYGPAGWRGGVYMYDDAWDDWYDHREDAREDWQDHREDLADERTDRAKNTQEQRTDRTQARQSTSQAQADQRRAGTETASATAQGRTAGTSQEARGYSRDGKTAGQRTGASSDAFSGYSSGKSERAASARGKSSRTSSRSGGARRR